MFIPPIDDNVMVPMRPPQRQDVRLPEPPPVDIEPPSRWVTLSQRQQTLAIKQDVAVL